MGMIVAADLTFSDFVPVLVQFLLTVGVIFGGAGFWQWKMNKEQVKRDALSKETGTEKKIDLLSEQMALMDEKVDSVKADVAVLKDDMSELKDTVALLDKANAVAEEYISSRNEQDQEIMIAQRAIVESLTGLLRDRLLDAYNKCYDKGYYTKEERETYGELFRCYESAPFNGNGVMHQLRPIMQALPWTKEEATPHHDAD